ncbi:unnamed protein product [Prorocentrum cordatum]|uniref:50S ribosomal protein L10 n=1 Tax=Prorocentrum cordatum TaxID=2364126 RepID=A0ABN9VPY6_9DINO|nr:unnamed protein product [Polarella glacialis]
MARAAMRSLALAAAAAAACGLLCTLAPHAFAAPVAPRALAPGSSVQLGGRHGAAQLAGPVAAGRGDSGLWPLALGALAAGALAAARSAGARRGRSTVARRVTLEDIESLTMNDIRRINPHWRPKCTLGTARRAAVCESIIAKLESSYFVMIFNQVNATMAESQKIRDSFPMSVVCRRLKNGLLRKALNDAEGGLWKPLAEKVGGYSTVVFVPDDKTLKDTVKAYKKVVKEFKLHDRCAAMNEYRDFLQPFCVGGIIRDEWELIPGEKIPDLENFQTKTDLICSIARGVKMVTQKIAVGVKQVPSKLAVGTKKVVEKMEEGGKDSVADVVA